MLVRGEEATSCKGQGPLRLCVWCLFFDHIKSFRPGTTLFPLCFVTHPISVHSPWLVVMSLTPSSPCPVSLQTPNPGSLQPLPFSYKQRYFSPSVTGLWLHLAIFVHLSLVLLWLGLCLLFYTVEVFSRGFRDIIIFWFPLLLWLDSSCTKFFTDSSVFSLHVELPQGSIPGVSSLLTLYQCSSVLAAYLNHRSFKSHHPWVPSLIWLMGGLGIGGFRSLQVIIIFSQGGLTSPDDLIHYYNAVYPYAKDS